MVIYLVGVILMGNEKRKYILENEDSEKNKDVNVEPSKKEVSKKNKRTFLGLLAVSAAIIAASAMYTKREIEKLDKNGK